MPSISGQILEINPPTGRGRLLSSVRGREMRGEEIDPRADTQGRSERKYYLSVVKNRCATNDFVHSCLHRDGSIALIELRRPIEVLIGRLGLAELAEDDGSEAVTHWLIGSNRDRRICIRKRPIELFDGAEGRAPI